MCGIFGIFAKQAIDFEATAARMAGRLTHRGPDEKGWHQDGRALLGNTRLSIIDVARGQQPVFSADRRVCCVQNGEIYNYVELREELKAAGSRFTTDSDTEVICRAYEAWGVSFVEKLNGMFAIAIWDGREAVLHLFRDRLGQKPLFITEQDSGVAFASEIKALLATGVPVKPRVEAIHHYLSFNYVPHVLTMFDGIGQVMPGWAASISATGVRHWQWWEPSLAVNEKRSAAEWQAELLATLSDAVRIHLRSDVAVGAFLSGGVDSSSVVALASECLRSPMHSFSIGFDEPRFDESPYAAEVAGQYRTLHHRETMRMDMTHVWPHVISHCEQPHGDASFMPTYQLSRLAAGHVKVVLTGDGGDELFAGYERHAAFLAEGGHHFASRYFANQGLLTHKEKLSLYRTGLRAQLADVDSAQLMWADFAACEHLDVVNRMAWMDMKWLLPGNNLVKPDRMGMANALEARVPFLDNRVIALAMAMPGRFKLHDGIPKFIMKEAMKTHLSHRILHRPKQMFTVPIGEWFRGHLAPYLRGMLLSDRAMDRGFFSRNAVSALVEQHVSGLKNHTRSLRALVALEHWFRLFTDGDTSTPTA